MKKILFDLQLFAEEAAAAQPEAGTEPEKTTEDSKPATEQKPKGSGADDKKYSDEDVNKLIDKKFAEWQKKKDQEIAEAEKLAKMNAEEKANFNAQKEKERADKAEARIAELERKDTLSEMSKTARKMLSDEGISISDELLSRLVTTDAAETKAAVDSFTKLFKAAVDDAVKDKARGTTPKNIINNSDAMSEIEQRIAKYN